MAARKFGELTVSEMATLENLIRRFYLHHTETGSATSELMYKAVNRVEAGKAAQKIKIRDARKASGGLSSAMVTVLRHYGAPQDERPYKNVPTATVLALIDRELLTRGLNVTDKGRETLAKLPVDGS